jgi:hypothetical protein
LTTLAPAIAASRPAQAGAGRQVQAARIVPAGAHGIHGRQTLRNCGAQREFTHRRREAADFLRRLTFGAQCCQQCARKCSIHFAGRERVHQLGGFGLGQVVAVE